MYLSQSQPCPFTPFPFLSNPDIPAVIRAKVEARLTTSSMGTAFFAPAVAARLSLQCIEIVKQIRDLTLFRRVTKIEMLKPIENRLSSHPQSVGWLFEYQKLALEEKVLTRLGAKPEQGDTDTDTDTLEGQRSATGVEHFVLIALLLFLNLFAWRGAFVTSSALMKSLAACLRVELAKADDEGAWRGQEQSQSQGNPLIMVDSTLRELRLWILFMGALATEGQETWMWFVDEIWKESGMGIWTGVGQLRLERASLKGFLYVEERFDEGLGNVWAQIGR